MSSSPGPSAAPTTHAAGQATKMETVVHSQLNPQSKSARSMIKIVLKMITLVVQETIAVVKQGQKLKFLKHVLTTKKMVLKLQLVIESAKEIVAVHQLIL